MMAMKHHSRIRMPVASRYVLEIVSDFESRGFRPVAMRGLVSRPDRCFEFPHSNQELGKYVLLEHKPKLDSFSVSFGSANSEAKRRANSVLASLTSAQLPGIGVLRERVVSQPWLTSLPSTQSRTVCWLG
jgi:hypothetical protein